MSERGVVLIGQDDEWALFGTPSWSGKDEYYHIWVRKKDWKIKCDCFGSNRWSLHTDLVNPNANAGCRHSRAVARMIERYLAPSHEL